MLMVMWLGGMVMWLTSASEVSKGILDMVNFNHLMALPILTDRGLHVVRKLTEKKWKEMKQLTLEKNGESKDAQNCSGYPRINLMRLYSKIHVNGMSVI